MRQRYSFDRLDLEAQQYFGFFNQRRVIALRGKVEATDPRAGNEVPFYLQPTLGGSDDLRGFRPFRFYDNNAVVLNGEYRWEVFSGLDMALFVDAGRVFHDWHQINLRELETDYGFGFRFNARNNVFLRLDTAFSREGFQIWFRFNNVF
jgi:outer membrane protein assembly factor BamA